MRLFLKNILLFSLVLIPFIIGLIVYNYWLDPYGVLRGNMQGKRIRPNERYLKVKHLINNPKKYNSFLFGSSRDGYIDISQIHDSNKYYNLSYSEGVPHEFLEDIIFLLKNNVDIKNVIIGLDNISYLVSPDIHKTQPQRMKYVSEFDPYFQYIILRPSVGKIREIINTHFSKEYVRYDIYNTGVSYVINKDAYIEKNPELHCKRAIFNRPLWESYYYPRIDPTIKDLIEIKKVCNEHNINLLLFINPMHVTTYLKQNMNDYFTFLRKLSDVIYYYDFSGLNKITTNNFYYFETSHFRSIVGNKITDCLFYEKCEDGFGRLVNNKNIDIIIKEKKDEIIEYNTKEHYKRY